MSDKLGASRPGQDYSLGTSQEAAQLFASRDHALGGGQPSLGLLEDFMQSVEISIALLLFLRSGKDSGHGRLRFGQRF
jgi:hypothetical protein